MVGGGLGPAFSDGFLELGESQDSEPMSPLVDLNAD